MQKTFGKYISSQLNLYILSLRSYLLTKYLYSNCLAVVQPHIMPPSYYFHALNPPEVKIYGDNFIAIGNRINCLLPIQSNLYLLMKINLQYQLFFLNELLGKKITCFQYGFLFSQFLFRHLNSSSVFFPVHKNCWVVNVSSRRKFSQPDQSSDLSSTTKKKHPRRRAH